MILLFTVFMSSDTAAYYLISCHTFFQGSVQMLLDKKDELKNQKEVCKQLGINAIYI